MPPKRGKLSKQEFYETFQDQIDRIKKNDYIIVAEDYNARVGIIPIDGILGTNGEIITNNNGDKLKEFASVNELKIMNTFFRHKEIHKFYIYCSVHRNILWNNQQMRQCAVNLFLCKSTLHVSGGTHAHHQEYNFNCINIHWYNSYCKK